MRRPIVCIFLLGLCIAHLPSALAQQNADCINAMDICKKQTYTIKKTAGEGSDRTEADLIACFMNGENFGQAERNSTWIKFEVLKGGSLTFVITPHKIDDEIDFVVFKLPADGDCRYKRIVRCMAAGDQPGNALSSPCMGPTGLREGETDTSEDAGCTDEGDNTWLAPLKTVAGEKYVILISNITSTSGFDISFGGSAYLPCDTDPPKTVAEAPKPKPAPPPKPDPSKTATAPEPPSAPKPERIEGREVKVRRTAEVKGRKIKISLWDNQVEDGDIVSVYVNDEKVLRNIYLRKQPKTFEIELPPGKEHYITLHAEDFGKAEPNSASMLIDDGVNKIEVNLVATRKAQESVKIVVE